MANDTVTLKFELTATYTAEILDEETTDPDEVARSEKVDLERYVEEFLALLPENRDVNFSLKPVFTP